MLSQAVREIEREGQLCDLRHIEAWTSQTAATGKRKVTVFTEGI
jgi:hypothetical protein